MTAQATAQNVAQMFNQTATKFGAKTVLRYRENKEFHDISYSELAKRVETAASALAALGVVKGDRVAILSENRPQWAILDLAGLSLGAIIVPIYPTLPSPQVAYILRNSGAKVLGVENAKQLAKVSEAQSEIPELAHTVLFEGSDASGVASALTWSAFLQKGEAAPLGAQDLQERINAVAPDDVASLVYTSGTTGDPKGAMLTHGNFLVTVDASLAHYAGGGEPVTHDDTFLSFLPLSHAYERTTGYYLPIRVGASIGYSEGVRTLTDDMAAVQPTIMVCVPRVYEAVRDRILDAVSKREPADQKKFHEALEAGIAWANKKMAGEPIGLIESGKRAILDKLAYSKIRERFGGKLRFLVSGGSPLNPDTARFFAAIGVPISEGYGMTEAAPVMTTNPVNRIKVQTVGTVIPIGEIKIAGDGEILYRGPNVMKGYWKNDEATRELIQDGWIHTGDIGVQDSDGYLKITDRKKDIIVLGNGKNVAPQPIEAALKASPFISEIVLIGDKQSIITALVLPNKAKLAEWAKSENLSFADDDALLALPEAKKKIRAEIDAHSKHLADFEKVRKFTLLNTTFSVEGGEMTPTLKIKRKVVLQKFAREVAEMRGGDD